MLSVEKMAAEVFAKIMDRLTVRADDEEEEVRLKLIRQSVVF
jgi:hypothetical protein